MENQKYSIDLDLGKKLEFYVCSTNEIESNREIRELGIVVIGDKVQLDGDQNIEQIESLIKYLQKAKRYIKKFNENSIPSVR
jgi:hypothetical protein